MKQKNTDYDSDIIKRRCYSRYKEVAIWLEHCTKKRAYYINELAYNDYRHQIGHKAHILLRKIMSPIKDSENRLSKNYQDKWNDYKYAKSCCQ